MAKGYQKAVEAKLLHVVDEAFYSIPIDSASCFFLDPLISWASTTQCKPTKRGSNGGVSAASKMLKLAKEWKEKRSTTVRVA